MKLSRIHVAWLLALGLCVSAVRAQEQQKPEEKTKNEAQTATLTIKDKKHAELSVDQKSEVLTTPIKATIVFTEYEGDKKLKSFPYTVYINALDGFELRGPMTKLRVGSRVPVYTGKDQFSYFDVGTNIDARASRLPEGPFLLGLGLERSWVEGDVAIRATPDPSQPDFHQPVVRQFRSDLELKLREGQSIESTMATDPLSGKVMKVEVSLSVVK